MSNSQPLTAQLAIKNIGDAPVYKLQTACVVRGAGGKPIAHVAGNNVTVAPLNYRRGEAERLPAGERIPISCFVLFADTFPKEDLDNMTVAISVGYRPLFWPERLRDWTHTWELAVASNGGHRYLELLPSSKD